MLRTHATEPGWQHIFGIFGMVDEVEGIWVCRRVFTTSNGVIVKAVNVDPVAAATNFA